MLHRLARFGSPAILAAALLLFLLPFLVVSCDIPGGYGRMSAGGTTSYSGVNLAIGSSPSIDEERLRPAAEQESDALGAQPLVTLAAAGLLVALALAVMARWVPAAAIATASAVALVIGLLVARSSLVDHVARQAAAPLPAGKTAGDYVVIANGFWLSVGLAVVGAALCVGTARLESRRHDPPREHAGG